MEGRTLAHTKPGKPKKRKSKLKPPKEKHCRRCFRTTQTEAWRHAESRIIKFEHGGGIMGGKIPDSQTAWLCMDCDHDLSKPMWKNASPEELELHAEAWRGVIKDSHC